MLCGDERTTAVGIRHQVHRSVEQWSRLLSKPPADQRSGSSCSWSLLRICAEVSGAPKLDYSISQILYHRECASITAGTFRSNWEYSCRVWEHIAWRQGCLGASRGTWKYWCGHPECFGGLPVASRPLYIVPMQMNHSIVRKRSAGMMNRQLRVIKKCLLKW